ncbi:site-specific DNA-methyltransferase [uncultured Prevotella sp.]|uniref:DNA-methyltransferase n=1 Tax=Bacteroides acidifaciens TaxID=85831 RepID=UPI0025954DE8
MKIEPNNIYLGDCLEVMAGMKNGSVDAIICDLPYEVLHKNNPHAQWNKMLPLDKLWVQYERIIKEDGAIILFGQGMFTAKLMTSNPKMWRYNLVWDKMRSTGFLNANRMPLRCHEVISVFYKQMPVYHPQMMIGDCNHSRGRQEREQANNCYGQYKTGRTYDYDKKIKKVAPTRPNEKFPTSIIRIAKEHETTVFHPTQKPIDLIRYLIRTYTDKGDVVLDNTMGSGTTCVGCIMENRRYIGIEKDMKYFEVAKKRIEAQKRQYKLELDI